MLHLLFSVVHSKKTHTKIVSVDDKVQFQLVYKLIAK